jgi:hypothetical protein
LVFSTNSFLKMYLLAMDIEIRIIANNVTNRIYQNTTAASIFYGNRYPKRNFSRTHVPSQTLTIMMNTFCGVKAYTLAAAICHFTLLCLHRRRQRRNQVWENCQASQLASFRIGLQFHTKLDNIELKTSNPMYFSYGDPSIHSHSLSSFHYLRGHGVVAVAQVPTETKMCPCQNDKCDGLIS